MADLKLYPLVPRWRDSKGYLVLTRFTDKPWHAQDVGGGRATPERHGPP
jgi:hypothetical protein